MRRSLEIPNRFLFPLVLLAQLVTAQAVQKKPDVTSDQWKQLDSRTEAINREIGQQGNPEWAGIYVSGDIGFAGESIALAPKNGFVFRPYTDYFPNDIVDKFDFGSIEIKSGQLFLHPVRGNFEDGEAYYVRWGERHFLLANWSILRFLNEVNAGCDQFQSWGRVVTLYAPTKKDELKGKLTGTPTMPDPFKTFLLKSPIMVGISAIGASKIEKQAPNYPSNPWMDRTTEVTLSKGAKDGIWAGMQLFVLDPNDSFSGSFATVIKVNDNTAVASIYKAFSGKEPPLPTINNKLTSRLSETWFADEMIPEFCW